MTRGDSQAKSDSHTPITMLTEVENVINSLQLEFDQYKVDDDNVFTQEQQYLKKHNRQKAAEENLLKIKADNDKKALQR